MQFKNLFDDNRAVSPVIGVILMVAITVILAAVIGSFVLGLGGQVQDTSPTANFGFSTTTVEVATSGGAENPVTAVTITHETGNSISASNLNVLVNGQQAYTEVATDGTDNDYVGDTFTSEVNAGSSITIIAASNSDSVTTGASGTGSHYEHDGTQLNIDGQDDGYGGDADNSDTDNSDDVADVGIGSEDTIRVVWTSDTGENSATLGTFELP